MSAWIVSKEHIDAIVGATIITGLTQHTDADATGRMLWKECLASVADRYPNDTGDNDRPGPMDFKDSDVDTYEYTASPEFPLVWLVKALRCYGYQSCEHTGWDTSEAKRITELAEDKLRYRLGGTDVDRIPGYDDAPWGIDKADVEAFMANPRNEGVQQ